MTTKLHFRSIADTATPAHLSRFSRFSSPPIAAELQRSCVEMNRAAEKIEREREEMNFGSRIASAVRARLQKRPRIVASASDDENSFAEKLRKAVEKKSGRKEREERLKRERERYHNRPRPHTKSD
jgi:hypothetical protein